MSPSKLTAFAGCAAASSFAHRRAFENGAWRAWDDVRHAIDAIGATTPVDIRDRAVLLLLATTGIRNGELRAIRLRDIDWHTGEVFVRRTKGKRDRMVPLLEETGAALADYILRARPKVDSPYLFLSFTPPMGPFKCAAPVSRIVRKRLRHGSRYRARPTRLSVLSPDPGGWG